MEHRGVEYRIIQGIKRGFWKCARHNAGGSRRCRRLADQQCRDGAGEAHQQDAQLLGQPGRLGKSSSYAASVSYWVVHEGLWRVADWEKAAEITREVEQRAGN
jgi:hypothetical protein